MLCDYVVSAAFHDFLHKLPLPNNKHVEDTYYVCGVLYSGGTFILSKKPEEDLIKYAKKRYGVEPCAKCFNLNPLNET